MLVVRWLPRLVLVVALVIAATFLPGAPAARAAATVPQPASVLLSGTFSSIVVDDARNRVYVSDANGSVGVINASTDAVLAWITLGAAPSSMDLSFGGSELLVSVPSTDKLVVINLTTDRIARSFVLSFSPGDVAAGRPGRAYLGNWGAWTYPEIVDTDTGRVVGAITAAGTYYQDPVVRISRDRTTLYTTDRWAAPTSIEKLSVTTDSPVLLGATPWGIDSAYDAAVSPDGGWFYYANPAAYLIEVFSTSPWDGTMVRSLNTGPYPRSVCLSDYGRIAFAVAETQSVVFAFNAMNGSLLHTYGLDGDPTVVRSLENGSKAYVITTSGLEVVATGLAVAYPIPEPVAIADPPGGYIPLHVAFYSSILGGTSPYNETWTLGDGTTAWGAAPAHVYTASGTYSVRLDVRDAKSATGSTSLLVTTGPPPGPNPLQVAASWAGESFASVTNPWVPPDVQVAVGPTDVVEMVNTRYEVFDRSGLARAEGTLASLFEVPSTDFLTDPRVVYDTSSLSFFASIADMTRSQVELAVSTMDPTLPWSVKSFASSSGCPDQPYLGIALSVVILSDNGFSDCPSATATYVGGEYWIVNKTDILLGRTPRSDHVGPDPTMHTMFPATVQTYDPDAYMVSVDWAWDVVTTMHLVRIAGSPPGPLTVTETTLPIRPLVQPPNGVQPGTTLLVNTGDARVQDAFLRNGDLWISLGGTCLPVGAAANRSCARIFQIDPMNATVLQDFDIGTAAGDVYYPAIAVDGNGDLVVTYGFSSSTTYPSVLVAAQLAGDPLNTTRTPLTLRTGNAAAVQVCDGVSCRYGDYFGAWTDPLDPQAVWIAGQYAVASGWTTVVAEVGVFTPVHLTLSYSLVGGGRLPSAPSVLLWSAGAQETLPLATSPQTYAMDLGSPWFVEPLIAGRPGERWLATSPFFGLAANGTSQVVSFQHQFLVVLAASPPEGGSLSGVSGWYSANATLTLTGTATAGWKLMRWEGNGSGSYSGSMETKDLAVSSPITETAIFYPGLTIEAGPGGSVAYAYANVSGIAQAGTTTTLYIANGTQVTLSAATDFFDKFTGWSGGATGDGFSVTLTLSGPESVRASFALSVTVVVLMGGIPAIVVVAAVLAVVLVRGRKRAHPPPPSAAPLASPAGPLPPQAPASAEPPRPPNPPPPG
jgi:PKD repeat protein